MPIPGVPLTIEGCSILHQMFHVRWGAWRALPPGDREHMTLEGIRALEGMSGTALYAMLGHKGDLMLVHFRKDFEELAAVQLQLAGLPLSDYLTPVNSYLSVLELGLYESSAKAYAALAERGVEPHSEPWNAEIEGVLARQREAMARRLWPEIPPDRYICFYPMDRRRGEHKNWYSEPMGERVRMMHEHGLVGRRYAGAVKQIISGSIGFDNWEWGVDLFAGDPLVFKKLIYEMRFDEVSAVYALFGPFFMGLRFQPKQLGEFLAGELPAK